MPWPAHPNAPVSVEVIEDRELTWCGSDGTAQFLDSITTLGPR